MLNKNNWEDHKMKTTWQSWVIAILGVWIFISAFLNLSPTGNLWSNLIVGIVVAMAGFWMVKEKPWQGWLSGLVGLWLIIAAFALHAHTANMWNDAIVGLVFMVAGFGAIGSTKSSNQNLGEHTHAHA